MSDEEDDEYDVASDEDTEMGGTKERLYENDGDDDEEDNEKETMVMNPTSVRERIDYALEILSDFKSREDKSQSRVDIIAALSKDLSEYYGYINELSDFLLDLFSPSECVEYMDASDRPRPMVIRTNTIKSTRKDLMEALSKRGSTLEAVEWSKVAIKVTESSVPIGATPEYLAGYYMLQSAASLNPVMALAPQPGERILDMASAPGGKTSYIAQLMKNSGTIIANDLKPQRQKATVANLHRMGVKNAIVCCYDGRKIPKIMKGFDRVLLDAPCSGLGVISRDQTVKLQRTFKDIQRIAHLQKELLCAAIDAVDPTSKTGGIVVYSTCSISSEENEQVVNYILQKRFVRLVETGLEVGKPGLTRHKERRFHPSLALTRRFYPHVHNMDGFYVAKLQKYANGVRGDAVEEEEEEEEDEEETEQDVEALRVAAKAAATIERKESRRKEAAEAAANLGTVPAAVIPTVKKVESKEKKPSGKEKRKREPEAETVTPIVEKAIEVKETNKAAPPTKTTPAPVAVAKVVPAVAKAAAPVAKVVPAVAKAAAPVAKVAPAAAPVDSPVAKAVPAVAKAPATPKDAVKASATPSKKAVVKDAPTTIPKAAVVAPAKSPAASKTPVVKTVSSLHVKSPAVKSPKVSDPPAKIKMSRSREDDDEEDEEEPRNFKKRRMSIKDLRVVATALKKVRH
jgi:25S rRNA (cytosine2870-C5)-methyltransferase